MRWFKPFGFVFLPISIPGWIVSAFAGAFCLHIFLFVDGRSHSVSDTLYGVFPYWVPTFLLRIWIADRTSLDGERQDSDG
ncbi:MAG TPA: hypothetical protein VIX14_01135 [Terriglobales bacterium]